MVTWEAVPKETLPPTELITATCQSDANALSSIAALAALTADQHAQAAATA